jgi:large subunit ribosomal protein L28
MLPRTYRPAVASASRLIRTAAAASSSTASSSSTTALAATTASFSSLRLAQSRTTTPPSSSTRSLVSRRAFSSTPALQTKTIKPHLLPSKVIPPYPYGERRIYKQSNRGLYGSARVRFGNNVAPKHKVKTQRFWRPNVHVKRFALPSVGASVKTRLTLRVLKTIRREGGLEEYLLKSKPQRVKDLGPGGWNLRWLIMQSRPVQERFNKERVELGLEPREIVDHDDLIQFALDFATPGPLSVRSRATLAALKAADQDLATAETDQRARLGMVGDEFVLGNSDGEEWTVIEPGSPDELSPEEELEIERIYRQDEIANTRVIPR